MKRKIAWILMLCLLLNLTLLCGGCKPNTVEVTFQPNNGDPVVTVNVEKGALIENAPTPKKRACNFLGWYQGETAWDLATNTVSESITLTAKWTLSEDAFEKDPNAGTRAEGTDIRVCSFNILSPEAGAKLPIAGRDTGFLHFTQEYLPDVIALQEFNSQWYAAFANTFQDTEYQLVNADNHAIGKYNVNVTLAYRTSALTLMRCDSYSYQVSDNKSARTVTWALFEKKDGSKQQFIALSTHWSSVSQAERDAEALELATWVNALKKKHNVPVVVMGDLNAYEQDGNQFALSSYKSSACYHTLMEKASLTDVKYAAAVRGLAGETHHRGDGTGSRDDLTSGFWKLGTVSFRDPLINTYVCIDHIFYTHGMEALYYDTVINEEVLNISDHNPIYADLKFISGS